MTKSDVIADLAAALSALQAEAHDAHRSHSAGGRYKYASLEDVLDIARPLLAKHGLSVMQLACDAPAGHVAIETVLLHKSGQYVSSTLPMPIGKPPSMNPAQAVGSAITYARRYALAGALGITQTDDDAASCGPSYAEPKTPAVQTITAAQLKMIEEMIDVTGTDIEQFCGFFKIDTIADLPDSEFERVKTMFERKLAATS